MAVTNLQSAKSYSLSTGASTTNTPYVYTSDEQMTAEGTSSKIVTDTSETAMTSDYSTGDVTTHVPVTDIQRDVTAQPTSIDG